MTVSLTQTGWIDELTGQMGLWTTSKDSLTNNEANGLPGISNEVRVRTMAGDDIVSGSSSPFDLENSPYSGVGIINRAGASLGLGIGDDILSGKGKNRGLVNEASSDPKIRTVIDMGKGNDTVVGIGNRSFGIFNTGINALIKTHTGDDVVEGVSNLSDGIRNIGQILTGDGNDTIKGFGGQGQIGVNNGAAGRTSIKTGRGSDTLAGKGFIGIQNDTAFIDMGTGDDLIAASGTFVGLNNSFNRISTGSGDDTIIGEGTRSGIFNHKATIKTGSGRDTVNALKGGFEGNGTINLGSDSDLLLGFGSGTFIGGGGTDRLVLPEGDYRVSLGSGRLNLVKDDITMMTRSFEEITGVGNATVFDVADLQSGDIISF